MSNSNENKLMSNIEAYEEADKMKDVIERKSAKNYDEAEKIVEAEKWKKNKCKNDFFPEGGNARGLAEEFLRIYSQLEYSDKDGIGYDNSGIMKGVSEEDHLRCLKNREWDGFGHLSEKDTKIANVECWALMDLVDVIKDKLPKIKGREQHYEEIQESLRELRDKINRMKPGSQHFPDLVS